MKKLRNIVVACDYAYVEGGAAGMAILTAVLLSRQAGYKVYFLGGCGEAAQELKEEFKKAKTLEDMAAYEQKHNIPALPASVRQAVSKLKN